MSTRQGRRAPAAIFVLTLIAAAAAFGCSSGRDDDDDTHVDPERHPRLELVSSASQVLLHGASTNLTVRYVYEDGEAIGNATIGYEISGSAGGSVLDARSTVTDAAGHATVRLTAGSEDATFQVVVTPPEGDAVTFSVSVAETEVGAIVVHMSYDGEQAFTTFRPYLWMRRQCESLDPERLPLPAERSAPAASAVTERPRFDNLTPADDYTVVVVAEVSGVIRGWGCADSVTVTGSQDTTADVVIEDIVRPLVIEGVYELESYLDMSGNLPPSVDQGVAIFDELTDDVETDEDGLCGSSGARGYGTDPGAFILDFAMRQTCAWYCNTGETFETCDEHDHPSGDISALCLHNFQDTGWDGAQPAFFGGCGVWELGAEAAISLINEQIATYVPAFVTDLLNMAGDLSRAIDRAHVYSLLTIDEPGELGAPFTHVLTEMAVRLRDWEGTVHDFRFDLAEAGFASLTASETAAVEEGVLVLPDHRFELDYGELIRFIYVHGLLRTILGYDDTAEMLADWIDCDAVATWLAANVGILSHDTYMDACAAGLEVAGGAIEDQIAHAVDAAGSLTLAGTVEVGDVDDDNVVQTLENGEWTGTWGEGDSSGPVTGDFTGIRQ